MTSVPNHRPPLSGNRYTALLAVAMLLLWSGCDAIRNLVTGPQPRPPAEKVDPRKELPPMDTIQWTDPADPLPPIVTPAEPRIDDIVEEIIPEDPKIFATYEIAVLLPFMTSNRASMPGSISTQRAMAFYHGMLLGLDELRKESINLQLYIRDTEADAGAMRRILNTDRDVSQAHIFIGGARSEEIKVLAEHGRNAQRIVISPFAGASDGIHNNPWFLQVNPGMHSISRTVMQHIARQALNANVTLVAADNQDERSRLKVFEEAYRELPGSGFTRDSLNKYLIPATRGVPHVNVNPYLKKGRVNVFVVPSWSSENMVLALVQELSLKSREYDIMVFGMPQWDRFEQINFDFFEHVNLHIPSPSYTDVFNEDFMSFATTFYERFGYIPDRAACLGHDLIIYTGRMLSKHGIDFRYYLEEEPGDLPHNRFVFRRQIETTSGIFGLQRRQIRHFENEFVDILQYRDYRFQKARH